MIINNKKIKTLIGPTNIIVLKPNVKTLPIIILMCNSNSNNEKINDFKLGKNDYKVYDDNFLSLLNDSKYKIDIFFSQQLPINLKIQEEYIVELYDGENFTNKILDNNCFNRKLKDTKCKYKNINWHYADVTLLFKSGNDYKENIIFYINVILTIIIILNHLTREEDINYLISNDGYFDSIFKYVISKEMLEKYYVFIHGIITSYTKDDIIAILKSITENDKILKKQFKNNKLINFSDIYINYISEKLLYINDKIKNIYINFNIVKNLSLFYDFIIDIIFYIIQYLIKEKENNDIKYKYNKLRNKILKKINNKYNVEQIIDLKKIIDIQRYHFEYISFIFFDLYNIARIHKRNNVSNICILIANNINILSISTFLSSQSIYNIEYIYDSEYKNDTDILKIDKKVNIDDMIKS